MEINIRELFLKQPEQQETIEFSVEPAINDSSTSEIYNARLDYKEKVNDKNLPIGLKSKQGKNLKNQLDTWYKEKKYGKYDYNDRIIRFNKEPDLLKQIDNNEFFLLNFVTDAVNQFLIDCSIRKKHPDSLFNEIKITKAYVPEKSYVEHQEKIYESFFNDVLNDIKYTNNIKTFSDYLELFYIWFSEQDTFITETGFYENIDFNIYNQGLAFNFFEIKTEEDKQKVLKDPRYAVINYCAKINGLRIDPNNPGTIIADLESVNLLEKHVKKYFPDETNKERVLSIYRNYFSIVYLETVSKEFIIKTMGSLSKFYNRFIKKYSSYTSFDAGADISQTYKKKFESNKIKREPATNETFRTTDEKGVSTINKFILKFYVKLRAKEANVYLSKKQIKFVVDNMYNLLVITDQLDFNKSLSKNELLSINHQALNYLESFLLTQKTPGNKREFSFFWQRAVKEITEEEIQLSKLLAGLDAIRIGCKGTHAGPDGLFLPCKTPEELFSLTNKQ